MTTSVAQRYIGASVERSEDQRILTGTGMVEAMSRWVVAAVPPAWGPYMAPITAGLSLPFTFFLSNDAFYFGVLPVLEELGPDTLVVQLDAHLDVYHFHDTTAELSHGNFLRHLADGPAVVNVGHRDLFLTAPDIRATFAAAHSAVDVATKFERVLGDLRKRAAAAKRVWIDLDADAVDPAYLPAVGQPLPFGLTPLHLLAVIDAVWSEKVAGVSVSEFDPGRDVCDTGLQFLGWLVEYLLLKRHGG